jgi:hypothetical protein
MTTSTIKIERAEEMTTFSYNTMASRTNSVIGTPTVYVQKYDENEFFVSTDDLTKNVEKTFSNEDDADLFAMKILMNDKKNYN